MLVIALKCWHCDSVQNAYCGEPFAGKNLTNPTTYVQCPPKDANSKSVCVKAKVKRKEKNSLQMNSISIECSIACYLFGLFFSYGRYHTTMCW